MRAGSMMKRAVSFLVSVFYFNCLCAGSSEFLFPSIMYPKIVISKINNFSDQPVTFFLCLPSDIEEQKLIDIEPTIEKERVNITLDAEERSHMEVLRSMSKQVEIDFPLPYPSLKVRVGNKKETRISLLFMYNPEMIIKDENGVEYVVGERGVFTVRKQSEYFVQEGPVKCYAMSPISEKLNLTFHIDQNYQVSIEPPCRELLAEEAFEIV